VPFLVVRGSIPIDGFGVDGCCWWHHEPGGTIVKRLLLRGNEDADEIHGEAGDDWIGPVKEMAKSALFLASDDSSYITRSEFLVDGGITAAYVTPD